MDKVKKVDVNIERKGDGHFYSLVSHFQNYSPNGLIFESDGHYYLYDTGLNKIIGCDQIESDVLKVLFSTHNGKLLPLNNKYSQSSLECAAKGILHAIDKYKILKSPRLLTFRSPWHKKLIHQTIYKQMNNLLLEVTQQCNLRCDYCIYQPHYEQTRNFKNKKMNVDVATKSIDLLYANSEESENIIIGFYGGEPLLNFELVKNCIEYSKIIFKNKKLSYHLTTNLTLMTSAIAEYLASQGDISISGSIDGPKEIHDLNRKYKNGRGSYKNAIQGLKILKQVFGQEFRDKVDVLAVYAPPWSEEKLNKITKLFEDNAWLPKDISTSLTYPIHGSIHDKDTNFNEDMPFLEWAKSKIGKSDEISINPLSLNAMLKSLQRIHYRVVSEEPDANYPFNGCCVPTNKKLYVDVDGMIRICEKSFGIPQIGDVFNGLDYDYIKKAFVADYENKSIESCKKCWAIKMCEVCYVHCYENGEFSPRKKQKRCNYMRHTLKQSLQLYAELGRNKSWLLEKIPKPNQIA